MNRHLSRLFVCAVLILAPALSNPATSAPATAPKSTAAAKAKAPAKPTPKGKGSKRKARLEQARRVLDEALRAAKSPAIKQGISGAQALVGQGNYQAARARVEELKRTAALSGEPTAAVLKLVDAEDALSDVIQGQKRRKPSR